MQVVILAGGFGTRLSEETVLRPKPMVEIGGKPILWHIMKHYSHFGFNDFVICLGYRGYFIKEYFANYFLHQSNVTFDLKNNKVEVLQSKSEDWKVTLIDTGLNSMTGGRVKRIEPFINGPFMLTYGDGVSDVDLHKLKAFHERNGKIATMTSVQPAGRFGAVNIQDESGLVTEFIEKPKGDGGWINAGFFVFEKKFFSYLRDGDATVLEGDPLESVARDGQMYTYRHNGFWKCMDTLRDKEMLESKWEDNPPWKLWKD